MFQSSGLVAVLFLGPLAFLAAMDLLIGEIEYRRQRREEPPSPIDTANVVRFPNGSSDRERRQP